ncbi:uncharacterized protein LOC144533010 [Sander vitreus]
MLINQLRTILRSISYPFSINNRIQISEANISTVCYPSSGSYHCLCEDQYRWPCDQCFLYGSCDNITDDTCGCINTIPPDGRYCQPADQYNFTACHATTPSPPPTNSTPVTTTDSNTTTATTIVTNSTHTGTTDLNTTTVETPTTFVTNSTPTVTPHVDNTTLTISTNSTLDTTTPTAIPTTAVTNSTQTGTTDLNTTTVETPTTFVTNSTPTVTPHVDNTTLTISTTNSTQTGTTDFITTTVETPTTFVTNSTLDTTTPTSIQTTAVTNSTQTGTTDLNTTTVEMPTTFVTNSTPTVTPHVDNTTLTISTNSTLDTTTPTAIPTTAVTNSTQTGTTDFNTTTVEMPTTFVTNSTPTVTPHVDNTTLTISTNSTLDTTTPTAIPTTVVTNSTQTGTTDFNTTTVETQTTFVTNSTLDTTTPTAIPTTAVTNSTQTGTTDFNTTTVETPTTFVTNSTLDTTTPTAIPTTAVTNSTQTGTTDFNTTTVETPTTFVTNSTTVATTGVTTVTTTPTTVTNSTPIATTHPNTTTPTSSPTSAVTNSTTVATTGVNTTTVTTAPTTVINSTLDTTTPTAIPTTAVTNSTQTGTTDLNTTTVETPTTFVTNSTTVATTGVTTVTTTPTTVTNSTPIATTHPNTTTPTSSPTSAVTNSTTVATTGVNTTTVTTAPTTVINSTLDTTTPTAIPTTAVTNFNTTTVETPTTFVTNSTPVATTHPNTTTPTTSPTTAVTNSTTVATTPTTVTNSTTVATTGVTTVTTTPTTVTNSTPIATTHPSTTTPTSSPTSAVTNSTVATTVFKVEMSMELDKQFTATLNDATSSEYKDLKSRIESVLKEQYKGITGFIGVSVNGFRKGSIITDFVVQTTQVKPTEVAEANTNLPVAMKSIATVIGSVTADYNSQNAISIPLTYTGTSMTLTCGPPDINVGQISGSEWKLNGKKITESARIKVNTSGNVSMLTVHNVILADNGLYECTLIGEVINVNQKGNAMNKIQQAPIIQLQSIVNVYCNGTEGQKQSLECCVQSPYTVKWFSSTDELLDSNLVSNSDKTCITYHYVLGKCNAGQLIKYVCKVDNLKDYNKTTEMNIFTEVPTCVDDQYGDGQVGNISSIGCNVGEDGSRTAVCQQTGWTLLRDTCIITAINDLLIVSTNLNKEGVPDFVGNLSSTVQKEKDKIATSSATISAIVDILNNIATVSTGDVTAPVMENILETVDVIIGGESRQSWTFLNANRTSSASSALLSSMESLSDRLVGEIAFATPRILLNRITTFNNSFTANLNNSIFIKVPNINGNVFFTTITFSTLNNVMPARNSSFDAIRFNTTSNDTVTDNAINAAVVLVKTNATVQNVNLSFNKLNSSLLLNPQCVFWNFTLFNNLGLWDDEGCTFVSDINNIVTCSCNHLTSFSILMATDIPPELREALDIITYFGVGISLASLVICLIIEGYVWKDVTRNSTSFMRHVSIINTALSLLIADICFIIGASIAKNPLENPGEDYSVPVGPCSTATFFMHFFYLALFFWMLVSGLLLFYRTVMVFSHMSKSIMLAIGFLLGYGCPLIIAVITVAVTAPGNGYIRADNACWLNWIETHALLALVIPALTIVFINIIIVIVVLFKMLRRGVGDATQRDEKQTLVVIVRCLAILTPLFGLTWALGVGTMISSSNKGIHIAFAFFNSLQGFFILVFGTLFDSKIRSILSRKLPTPSTGSNTTRSTSGGISSLSGLNWINRLRGRRYVYRVSEAANSSSTGASESFVNI